MLTGGSKDSPKVRFNEKTKLYAIEFDCPQWFAWVNWMYFAIGKTYFSKAITVPYEWPPTNHESAHNFAQWLSDLRDSPDGKGVVNPTPVPAHPHPWTGGKTLPPSPPCKFPFLTTEEISDVRARQRPQAAE
jgi:hypothetical protein